VVIATTHPGRQKDIATPLAAHDDGLMRPQHAVEQLPHCNM